MIVLPFQALFEVEVPPSVQQTPVQGHDTPNNPPIRQPRFSAGAMAATGLFLVLTPPSVVQNPVFDAWEVQPPQPPHPRPERSAAIAAGDTGIEAAFISTAVVVPFGYDAPLPVMRRVLKVSGLANHDDDSGIGLFVNWIVLGGQVQTWQPPHPRSERAAAILRGDDGVQAAQINWPNFGWEIQSVQPPVYPTVRQRYPGTKGKAEFAIFPNFFPLSWEVPLQLRPSTSTRSSAAFQGSDGFWAVSTAVPFTSSWGFESQTGQPPFYLTIKQRGAGASGESSFAAFDMQPFTEVQSWQPPHRRSEKAAAIASWPNIESVFIPPIPPVVILEGFEFQPLVARSVFKGGVIAAKDDGIQRPLINWFNAGWEIQPPPPPHTAYEKRAAAFLRGNEGNQATFIRWFVDGWAVQPWQPPHRRSEKAAAGMLGDTGTEAPYVFVAPPPLSPWGYEGPINVFYKRPSISGALVPPSSMLNIDAVYVFIPPVPPTPSPTPVQFRSAVFAVNCAQGNTNVAATSETNVFNPVLVGMSITLLVSSGNYLPPNTAGQTLIITKPDRTVIRLTYPDAFIGTLDTMTDVGLFLGGTYLVGGVYLDQAGLWSVQVVKLPVATALGSFFVRPAS